MIVVVNKTVNNDSGEVVPAGVIAVTGPCEYYCLHCGRYQMLLVQKRVEHCANCFSGLDSLWFATIGSLNIRVLRDHYSKLQETRGTNGNASKSKENPPSLGGAG